MSPAEQSALETAQRCASRCVELDTENQRLSAELENAEELRKAMILSINEQAEFSKRVIDQQREELENAKGEGDEAIQALGAAPIESRQHSDSSWKQHNQALRAELERVKGERNALGESLNQVDEVLVVNWVGPRKDGDYRRALYDLVSFNIQIHDDPQVSEVAANRQQQNQALREGLAACVKVLNAVQWENHAQDDDSCPSCGQRSYSRQYNRNNAHEPDCVLWKALSSARALLGDAAGKEATGTAEAPKDCLIHGSAWCTCSATEALDLAAIPEAIRKIVADPELVRRFNDLTPEQAREMPKERPCNSVVCQLSGMHVGQCKKRPIQVGDTVRHRTDPSWGTQVVSFIGEPYESQTISDTAVFFEAGGFWRMSHLERVDPPSKDPA